MSPGGGSDPVRWWHRATGLDRENLGGRTLDGSARPAPWKSYPDVARRALPSPPPAPDERAHLWEALARRRSRREFGDRELTREELAKLLWACQGVTGQAGEFLLRTAPSAGALYPFETYVSLQRVAGEAPCLAHLHVPTFTLEVIREGELGPHLAQAALGQGFVARAAAVVAWTAVLPRCRWKYGDRALRYLGLDLGHVAQNLALAAETLGLGCCSVAAFFDAEVNALLEVDGTDEFAYYLAAVGPLAGGVGRDGGG